MRRVSTVLLFLSMLAAIALVNRSAVAGTSDGNVVGTALVQANGPASERFNIVFLSDGFQKDQLPAFHARVQEFVNYMMLEPPFDTVGSSINVWRIDVASTDFGADDPTACGGSGATAATYFDATYCGDGVVRRLLTVNQNSARQVLDNYIPEWNVAIVLVNSAIHGGSGGEIGTSALAANWQATTLHELGHSAFGLADEYEYYRGCGIDTDRDRHSTAHEPSAPNVTIQTNRDQLKWSNLVNQHTPIPTWRNPDCTECADDSDNPYPGEIVTGIYEGAHYFHCDAYRPVWTCLMRVVARGVTHFCPVCQEAIREVLTPFQPTEIVNVDVTLIMDSSGSMRWNDRGNKRHDAARAYLVASVDDDQIGVVDFDGRARLASPLRIWPEGRDALLGAINSIDSSGSTNMRAGILMGCDELKRRGRQERRGAILLTDGKHNVGSFGAPQACFANEGWPIYTFGFGSADAWMLSRIAQDTGGEFKMLTTSDLVCEFQRVRALIAGMVPGPCETHRVMPGQMTEIPKQVPAGQIQATFSASWLKGQVDVSLRAPSGRIIDSSTVAPDVTREAGATFSVYTVRNPEAGEWTLRLFGASVGASGEEVVVGMTTIAGQRNRPPVSDAGEDQELECSGNLVATAHLDGSASSDPDSTPGTNDDILGFDWTEGGFLLASGETVDVTLGLGPHDITLTVTDSAGASDDDSVAVLVDDTTNPTGGITGPAEASCHGNPVTVSDDFEDVCDPDLERSYEPQGGPTYEQHGDYDVTVRARDEMGLEASDSVSFTVDLVAPSVTLGSFEPYLEVPKVVPISDYLSTSDDDGAAGVVLRERILVDDCVVYDGLHYGNGDGLLLDESVDIGRGLWCRAYSICGRTHFLDAVVAAEASDCGGNTGRSEFIADGEYVLNPDNCSN